MDIRTGIIQTANALGIDPLDLATAISYETAGTFNPTAPGPTTRFGQHRGFIQFGEPQAKQHGVDWNDPIRSQLGENGAVASYLRSSGVKPGMGLLDIYSAINAGAPGLYNRSDAAAGGAPGTVRDKVMNQMSGHRKKAAELLGMKTPMVSSQSSPAADVAADTMAALGKGGGAVTPDQIAQGAQAQSTGMQDEQRPRGLLGNLFGNPDTMANLALAFNSMRLNPDPNLGAVLTAQMKERREERETKRQRNATAQWLRSQKLDSLAQAVETGALTGAQAISLAKTESGKGTAAMQNYARYQQIAATEGPEAAEKFRKMFLGGQDINIDLSKGELSPGWKKIDEKFAETFNEWNIAGASDALKQTSQLRGVLNDLREGKPLTGPLLGLQPDVVQSFLNPDALNARQQVEEVVQRNLRKILGAQFTKEEGERLISRSFDQRLSPEQNAARLEALLNQMETAAQNTAAMVNYFQENGTLRGYEGNQFSSSISSFDQMFDELDRRQGISGGEGTMANPIKITPQTKSSDIPSGAYFIDPNGVLRQKP